MSSRPKSVAVLFVADDGGMAPVVDAAVTRLARAGRVHALSIAPGWEGSQRSLESALAAGLDVGWHLNLSEGPALNGVARGLTNAAGNFFGKQSFWERALAGAIDPLAVARELAAQARWWERAAHTPTHLDGHNHAHIAPPVSACVLDWPGRVRVPTPGGCRPDLPAGFDAAARDFGAARLRRGHRVWPFVGFAFSQEPSLDSLLADLVAAAEARDGRDAQVDGRASDARSVESAPIECMIHPGRRGGSKFTDCPAREAEERTLLDPRLEEHLAARGLVLGERSLLAEGDAAERTQALRRMVEAIA